MFNKYCWAYRKSVGHRQDNNFQGVMPSGKALLELPNRLNSDSLERMYANEFCKKYCEKCSSYSCEVNSALNPNSTPAPTPAPVAVPKRSAPGISVGGHVATLVDPVSNKVLQVVNSLNVIQDNKKYYDVPVDAVDVMKIVGRVNAAKNSTKALFCQGLLIDMAGQYAAILFVDGRDYGEVDIEDVAFDEIKLNVSGQQIRYDITDMKYIAGTDTACAMIALKADNSDDAIYTVKALFNRICDQIFNWID